ncbi:MAG TPA: hypothetical protein VF292_03925 [Rhodanobacteraceae bacterium]
MIRLLLHVVAYGFAYHYARAHGLHDPWMWGMGAVIALHILGGLFFRRRWYMRHRFL